MVQFGLAVRGSWLIIVAIVIIVIIVIMVIIVIILIIVLCLGQALVAFGSQHFMLL